ncbi:unnamed protein product, partial [marine sediment metagenome]
LEILEEERLENEKKEKARLEKIKKAKLDKERIKKARLEKKETEKETIAAFGLGAWFPSKDNNSFMIYEAQLRLKDNFRLFVGGGKSPAEPSSVSYFGVRIGDRLNLGIGGMNSSALGKTELMLTGGFSLGTDRVRLEGNYFYVPENQDANGTRVILEIKF